MPTIAEALALAQERLAAADVETPLQDGLSLLEHLFGLPRTRLLLERQRELSGEQWQAFERMLARRARREPLQHILGVSHFYGLELKVSPAVLVPRPETERLVELALQQLKTLNAPKVVDVGTGSGAIALAIKAERPDAQVTASDVSERALALARENAQNLGLDVDFVLSDLLEHLALQEAVREADLLLSNPPYLPEGDKAWISPEVKADPPEALFSGADGLMHYRRLEAQARERLRPGALLMLELDPRTGATALAAAQGWSKGWLEADLLGRKRFLLLRR